VCVCVRERERESVLERGGWEGIVEQNGSSVSER
jgi:hypothetical protein